MLFTKFANKEIVVYHRSKSQIGSLQLIIHYASLAIGTGVMKLGPAFQTGYIFAVLINTIFAITTYWSLHLMIDACTSVKCKSSTEAFSKHISPKLSIVFAIADSLAMYTILITFIKFIQSSVIDLFETFHVTIGLYLDNYLIAIYLFVIFIGPTLLLRNYKNITIISLLKFILIIVMLIIVIYHFIYFDIKYGFDPKDEIKVFSFNSQTLSCLSTFATAYLLQPIAAPGISSLKDGTRTSILKSFKIIIFAVYMLYNIFGLFEYFTLFDSNTGGIITSYYPDSWARKVANIVLVVMMCFSVILVINPVRYCLIKSISSEKDTIDFTTWVLIGTCLYISAFILTKASETFTLIVDTITDIFAQICLYMIPSGLFLAISKNKSKIWIGIAIFNIILAIALIILALYNRFMS